MSDSINWFAAAGVVLTLELFTGTFYLLMVAIGLAAAGLAALGGAALPLQTILAAAIGVLATVVLRARGYGKRGGPGAERDPNINLDIGQRVQVMQWQDGAARVMYRGAMWDVELAAGADPLPGSFIIREIRGSRLVVG
ncbi:MAG: NfeD family protein [Pseudomonadota bacterium]